MRMGRGTMFFLCCFSPLPSGFVWFLFVFFFLFALHVGLFFVRLASIALLPEKPLSATVVERTLLYWADAEQFAACSRQDDICPNRFADAAAGDDINRPASFAVRLDF